MSQTVRQLAVDRLIHQQVVARLTSRIYDQPIIGNVERGVYVECMVELAMHSVDPRWSLTATWDAWDLEHNNSRARIEVKQSSCLQSWSPGSPTAGIVKSNASFDIRPRAGYWDSDAERAVDTGAMRHADVYVFAWHGNCDPATADQRRSDQWEFYVVASDHLPAGQKTISLNPLRGLTTSCSFDQLAERVQAALSRIDRLKADSLPQ